MATATPMSANQTAYLNGLVKAGGGNGEWAKAQLAAPQATPVPQADPALVAQHQAAADAFKAAHWYNGGTTATPTTQSQNLANVYNSGVDPNKPVIPTPYISGVLSQAAKDTASQTAAPKPVGTFNTPGKAGDSPTDTTTDKSNVTPTPTATAAPNQYKDQYARTPDQIAALAKARIDAILQGGRTAAAGSLTSLRNANDYTNTIKVDSRTLENGAFNETHNPFSGQTGYAQANLERNRSIQDTAQNKDYNANVQMVQQKLADLETAAPGQEQQIIDDLQQIERTTGINVARLQMEQQNSAIGNAATIGSQTGQFTNPLTGQTSQTVAGKTAELTNQGQTLQNQLTQMKLDNYPAESKAAAQQVQQQLTAGQLDIDTAKFKLDQLKDPNSPINQADKISLQLKQMDLANAPEEARLKLKEMQKRIDQIGAAPYRTPEAKQKDQLEVDKLKAELAKLQNPPAKPKTPDSYKTDPNFSQDVAHLKTSPTDAAKLDTDPQPFIDAYGYDGYLALRKAAGLD